MAKITETTRVENIMNISPLKISVREGFNSREDFGDIETLAESIADCGGLLNPITVIRDNSVEEEAYLLVDGERRFRAVQYLIEHGTPVDTVKAEVLPEDTAEKELIFQQVVRNNQKNFNEYEYGIVCARLRDEFHMSNHEIKVKLGIKSDGQVTYYLRHIERPVEVQKMLQEERISGSNLRRLYKEAHEKHFSDDFITEALIACNNEEKAAGNKKVNYKDVLKYMEHKKDKDDIVSMLSHNKITKDTKAIQQGFELFFKYYDKYSKNRTIGIPVKIAELKDKLSDEYTIEKYFEDALATIEKKAE